MACRPGIWTKSHRSIVGSQALSNQTFPGFSEEVDISGKRLQDDFKSIKDSVQKVRIPKDFKSNDSNKGIKSAEQSKAAIINQCASYSETLLKILPTIEVERPLSEEAMNNMMTVVLAQIRYLQEENGISNGDIRTMESCMSSSMANSQNAGRGRGYRTSA